MKYAHYNSSLPLENREKINKRIIGTISSANVQEFSDEQIFNFFTGKGGLHGLNYADFGNYHYYSEAKKEREWGQFFTPPKVCSEMMKLINPSPHELIADLSCGSGNFFNFASVESNCYGCEIDRDAAKVAKHLYPDANIDCSDIQFYDPQVLFDVIFGNPPFNLRISGELSQFFYCLKSADLLKPGGFMALVIPVSFLNDDFLSKRMISEIDNRFNFVLQYRLLNAFPNVSIETKVVVFQKKSDHLKYENRYRNEFVTGRIEDLHQTYIKPLIVQREKLKSLITLELTRKSYKPEYYEMKKLLFQIKVGKNTKHKYDECLSLFNRFRFQIKPEYMRSDEWEKSKISESKVISKFKRILKNQHLQHMKDVSAVVKTDHNIKIKPYSNKAKRQIKGEYEWKINDLILGFDPMPEIIPKAFQRLIERKKRNHMIQSLPFRDMPIREDIKHFLDNFSFISKGWFRTLNDVQKEDLNRFIQKNYSILNWQQGSGKTPAAYAWLTWNRRKVRNAFIIGPAISVKMTWKPRLTIHKEDFIFIQKRTDIIKIKPGQIVLVSLSILTKYQKEMKKFVRKQSNKIALVFDESDEISNYNANRSRAVFDVFRRVKKKFLTTGTTTRNNVSELYQQFQLLYNHSVNFLCECETIYYEQKKKDEKEIKEKMNLQINKPFPPYFGFGLFKACFNPSKKTVFGLEKQNQDIFNSKHLRRLIEKTVISKKLYEIMGEKKFKIENCSIPQNDSERNLYRIILEELYFMIEKYYNSTGNDRKDNFLRIVRQLKLLIEAASMPQYFDEYRSTEEPNKAKEIMRLISLNNEKVAVGCLTKKAVTFYTEKAKTEFPDRKVFTVTGEVPFQRRQKILKEFEQTSNGLLISTQQSLKSSVNIPSCNRVIIESLPWNIPKLEQYFYRFIRFDSRSETIVYIITYKYTIENNIYLLLMAKERINEWVKTLELTNATEDEYSVDDDMLNMILQKSKDIDGRVSIHWGNQTIE